jgi:hypothetical protein
MWIALLVRRTAVLAPCVLASLADGIELLAAPPPVVPFFTAAPPPAWFRVH